MAFLLDTNIVSDLVRHPYGRVAQRIAEVGSDHVFTSILVAAELYYGTGRKRSQRLSDRLDGILVRINVLPFEAPADRLYAEVRIRLEQAGNIIGANDLFIAAHALALQYTLVTNNMREFSRIPGLKIENWLR
jgi:tRNA(fMet)-specific endonuclease VapC